MTSLDWLPVVVDAVAAVACWVWSGCAGPYTRWMVLLRKVFVSTSFSRLCRLLASFARNSSTSFLALSRSCCCWAAYSARTSARCWWYAAAAASLGSRTRVRVSLAELDLVCVVSVQCYRQGEIQHTATRKDRRGEKAEKQNKWNEKVNVNESEKGMKTEGDWLRYTQ